MGGQSDFQNEIKLFSFILEIIKHKIYIFRLASYFWFYLEAWRNPLYSRLVLFHFDAFTHRQFLIQQLMWGVFWLSTLSLWTMAPGRGGLPPPSVPSRWLLACELVHKPASHQKAPKSIPISFSKGNGQCVCKSGPRDDCFCLPDAFRNSGPLLYPLNLLKQSQQVGTEECILE